MSQPSFLASTKFVLPNYLLLALVVTCVLSMVPYASRQALETNSNKAEDWLPATYSESAELRWFRQFFVSEGFVLCTWDGCTLGNTEQLELLTEKLSDRVVPQEWVEAGVAKEDPRRRGLLNTGRWFHRIVTGPSMLKELTGPPLRLDHAEAIARLEGSLIGPPAVDATGKSLGTSSRPTAMVLFLAPEAYQSNDHMRQALIEIERVAYQECGIPAESFHLGGPPADNVAIDVTSERSFATLSNLSGLVGVLLAFWCFRSWKLTAIVVMVAVLSSMTSLAIVYYFGVGEVLLGGLARPMYGTLDAVLMSMPAVVYVLGLSGAVHVVNYYRDARREGGIEGAVERAVRIGFGPCALAAFTTAVGLASLAVSDIIPIRKFGAFSAAAVIVTLVLLFTLLPVFLHRLPPARIGRASRRPERSLMPGWLSAAANQITRHHGLVTTMGLILFLVVGWGLWHIKGSVEVLKLLDPDCDLISDYRWIEENLGNIVPMEVVVTIPQERLRSGEEHAEADGRQYRLTMLERLDLIRRLNARIEHLPPVSQTLSASTFAPERSSTTTAAARRSSDYTFNKTLEESRGELDQYVKVERMPDAQGNHAAGRELWRTSARVAALKDVDYGEFVQQLRNVVEPVLLAYRQRDLLLSHLHAQQKRLEGARLCVLYESPIGDAQMSEESPPAILAGLLRESGVRNRVGGRRGSLTSLNASLLAASDRDLSQDEQLITALKQQDVVIATTPLSAAVRDRLEVQQISLVDLSHLEPPSGSAAVALAHDDQPRPIRAVYTGIIPLVFKTQRQLLASLTESMGWAALVIAVAMALVLRSITAGLISMVPNVFPIVLVFGSLGWLGVDVDIGIMMTASVALGVAVDDTVHFLTWFRRGTSGGMDRRQATLLAYERCAIAMAQTTLIAGLGLFVFSASTFVPTQQFGYLMITMLAAALVGDLVLLPAILCGPAGRYFEGKPVTTASLTSSAPPEPDDRSHSDDDGPGPTLGGSVLPLESLGPPDSLRPVDSARPTDGARPAAAQLHPRADQPQLSAPTYATLRDKLRRFRRDLRPPS